MWSYSSFVEKEQKIKKIFLTVTQPDAIAGVSIFTATLSINTFTISMALSVYSAHVTFIKHGNKNYWMKTQPKEFGVKGGTLIHKLRFSSKYRMCCKGLLWSPLVQCKSGYQRIQNVKRFVEEIINIEGK